MKTTIEIDVEIEGKVHDEENIELTGVWLELEGAKRINIVNFIDMDTDAQLAEELYENQGTERENAYEDAMEARGEAQREARMEE